MVAVLAPVIVGIIPVADPDWPLPVITTVVDLEAEPLALGPALEVALDDGDCDCDDCRDAEAEADATAEDRLGRLFPCAEADAASHETANTGYSRCEVCESLMMDGRLLVSSRSIEFSEGR